MSGSVGALVTDLPGDFTKLGAGDAALLRKAFDDSSLLVFRGREISLEEQYAICELFGALIDQASNGTRTFNISNRGASTTSRLSFHADFTNAPPSALLNSSISAMG